MEDVRQKASEEVKEPANATEVKEPANSTEVKEPANATEIKEPGNAGVASKAETEEPNNPIKLSKTSTSTEQDLDVFLLGDLGDDDEGPGTMTK